MNKNKELLYYSLYRCRCIPLQVSSKDIVKKIVHDESKVTGHFLLHRPLPNFSFPTWCVSLSLYATASLIAKSIYTV